MAQIGPNDPTGAGNFNPGGADDPWDNPTNVLVYFDGNYAEWSWIGVGDASDWLFAHTFGLSLPAGATVIGVEVRAVAGADTGFGGDPITLTVQILDNDAPAWHLVANQSLPNDSTLHEYVYGGVGQFFGVSWDSTNVPTIQVAFNLTAPGDIGFVGVDGVRVTAFLQLPSAMDPRDVRLTGQAFSDTTRDLRLVGEADTLDERDTHITGELDSSIAQDAHLIGEAETTVERDLRIDAARPVFFYPIIVSRSRTREMIRRRRRDVRWFRVMIGKTLVERDLRITGFLTTSLAFEVRVTGVPGSDTDRYLALVGQGTTRRETDLVIRGSSQVARTVEVRLKGAGRAYLERRHGVRLTRIPPFND